MLIQGYRSVVSRKDGVRYVELYILNPSPGSGVVGDACEVVFLREDMIENLSALAPGVNVTVCWSKFGRGRVDKVVISV